MVTKIPLLLAGLAATSAASVLPSPNLNSSPNPSFISFPIFKERSSRTLSSRDAEASLTNVADTSYLIELSIGTPGQIIKVAVDTGSNELFVNPNCNDRNLASSQQRECEADGQYNSQDSSTANVTTTGNQIQFGTGAVAFTYVLDTIAIPGSDNATLTNTQFGVATRSQDLNEGILGIGFGQGVNLQYPNLIDQLAAQKITNTKAFSVALGAEGSDEGGIIIFGGVDTKKFSGSLASNTMLAPAQGDITRYSVQMNSITFKSGSTSNALPGSNIGVVLDTGSSLCELPSEIVDTMATDFNAQLSQDLYFVDCSYQTQSGSLDFAFPGVTISVPFADFILQDGNRCILGVQAIASDSGITALLGDSFLRSAYVVFDQTNNKISMAQYVNCGSNQQAIPSGSGGVSSFSGECDPDLTSSSNSKSAAGVTRPAGTVLVLLTLLASMVVVF